MNSPFDFLNILFFIIYIILFKIKTNMKKIWLLTTLLIWSLLLTGCTNNDCLPNNWEIDNSGTNNEAGYTWKYLALYPFWTEVKPQQPDYSWMTVQKLYNDPNIKSDRENHCWKDVYFLNSVYYKSELDEKWQWKSDEKIVIQEQPTKEPLYFDWEMYQNVWNDKDTNPVSLDHLEWNILLTWYLETHSELECLYCDEEEAKEYWYWTVEVWRIYPDDWNKYWWFVLWYTEWDHIVAIYPNIRFDDIQLFSSYNKCTEPYQINLRNIANDWKIHTFRVVLDDWGSQERAYFGSMIRERDFIE